MGKLLIQVSPATINEVQAELINWKIEYVKVSDFTLELPNLLCNYHKLIQLRGKYGLFDIYKVDNTGIVYKLSYNTYNEVEVGTYVELLGSL